MNQVDRRSDQSGEDAHAARADEQAQNDEDNAVDHLLAQQGSDAGDDHDDGDDPEDECHGCGSNLVDELP